MQYVSDHAYWWGESGLSIVPGAIAQSAAFFESRTLDVLRSLHGTLPLPSVAADGRVHVLNAQIQGAGAYFSSIDSQPHAVHPYSNELAVLVLNIDAFRPGTAAYDETLAHELQHMAHWAVNPANDTWFDEGVSEVIASAVRGTPGRGSAFGRRPDRSLLSWTDEPGVIQAQYDGSYLFAQYLADRYGLDMLGEMIRSGRAPVGINVALASRGFTERFDDLFADWTVANVKDARSTERASRYGYAEADPDVRFAGQLGPAEGWTDTVSQYGTDYLDIQPEVTAVEILGVSTVKIAPVEADNADLVWWSYRADSLDSTLTREVDLRQASAAVLKFRTWFQTEQHYDHGYVAVSVDKGMTWRALDGIYTDVGNPTGNAYGPSFTGRSGGDRSPVWVNERIDLSPFVGREILVRFEYVTDQGTSLSGWLIDDVEIEGTDGSARDGGATAEWMPDGFAQTTVGIPTRFLVQVIYVEGGQVFVEQHWFSGGEAMTIPLRSADEGRRVLTVSGVTPATVESMAYSVHALP
ncbi:MAG: hypothetical protein ACKVVP_25050 [Chloroflexota bacterium]